MALWHRSDLDSLKLYVTGGLGFEAFRAQLKAFDTSSVCGLVWNVNYVAYRCRTCALSPCMSICAECFKHGDHAGHDFNMFRSGAGGACDCGDECVMSPKGLRLAFFFLSLNYVFSYKYMYKQLERKEILSFSGLSRLDCNII